MLQLKFIVTCDHIGCEKKMKVLVDWMSIKLDLNKNKIKLPKWTFNENDWFVRIYSGYGQDEEEAQYYCPDHKKDHGYVSEPFKGHLK